MFFNYLTVIKTQVTALTSLTLESFLLELKPRAVHLPGKASTPETHSSSPWLLRDSFWSVTQAGFTVALPATRFRTLGSRVCSTKPDLLWGVLSVYKQSSTKTTFPQALALTNAWVICAPCHRFSQMDCFQRRSKQPTLFL